MVRNSILQPVTLGHRFTHEHGLMDGLSLATHQLILPVGGGGGGGGERNLFGARIFLQKSLDKPMERKNGLEVSIFFPKLP